MLFKRWTGLLVAMLCLFLVGCSLTGKNDAQQNLATAKEAIKDKTGYDAEFGEKSALLKGENGEEVFMSFDPTKLPDGFPLPVLPGFALDGYMEEKEAGSEGVIVFFQMEVEVRAGAEAYEAELKRLGAEVKVRMMEKDQAGLSFAKLGEQQASGDLLFANHESGDRIMAVILPKK